MRDESGLKSALMKVIKAQLPNFIAQRHEDVRTAGIPDLSLTGLGRTTWWEFKHATPHASSTGIQELTMLRLAAAGFARYVIWHEQGDVRRTLIVHPQDFAELRPEAWHVGFNHRFVVDYMREQHDRHS